MKRTRVVGDPNGLDGIVRAVLDDMRRHGEVHAVFEEHDAEVELRKGTTTFDVNKSVFRVQGPDTEYVFKFDSLVSYYKPMEVFH